MKFGKREKSGTPRNKNLLDSFRRVWTETAKIVPDEGKPSAISYQVLTINLLLAISGISIEIIE